MNKLIVILGPTSTGKTSLAIKLGKKFNGEIVSADSRQIYKYMDVGTGKMPVPKCQKSKLSSRGRSAFGRKAQNQMSNVKSSVKKGDGYWIIDDVYIHLYDVVEPDKKFSVARFKDAAEKEIQSIWRRGKVPFLVGGTGFYIAAVLGEAKTAGVPPNWELRRQLEKLSAAELFAKLQKLDPTRSESIDRFNSRRLIRAIEIAAGDSLKRSSNAEGASLLSSPTDVLKIGLTAPRQVLYRRADAWADAITTNGLIDEVQHLINLGYKDSAPLHGIIYKTVVEHFDGKISKDEMLERIKFDLHGYIRRQLTWFKRDKEINWLDITRPHFDDDAQKLVESFLNDE